MSQNRPIAVAHVPLVRLRSLLRGTLARRLVAATGTAAALALAAFRRLPRRPRRRRCPRCATPSSTHASYRARTQPRFSA